VAARGETDHVTLSNISGLDTVQVGFLSDDDLTRLPHRVYRGGTTIYWVPQEMPDFGYLSGETYIVVFLY